MDTTSIHPTGHDAQAVLGAAEILLKKGASSTVAVRRYARQALQHGVLPDFDMLLSGFDGDQGRLNLLDWLQRNGHLHAPGPNGIAHQFRAGAGATSLHRHRHRREESAQRVELTSGEPR